MTQLVVMLIKFYQGLINPLLKSLGVSYICKFNPSCSQYAVNAIEKYGLVKGGCLAATRIGRCHPWAQGGWEPVP